MMMMRVDLIVAVMMKGQQEVKSLAAMRVYLILILSLVTVRTINIVKSIRKINMAKIRNIAKDHHRLIAVISNKVVKRDLIKKKSSKIN